MVEFEPEKILLGTDYPREMQTGQSVKAFVEEMKKLPLAQTQIEGILGENGRKFLKNG